MQSAAASARRVASSAIRLSGVSEEASPASGAVRRHSPCYIRWVCRCHCTAPPGLRNCNRTGNFLERRVKTQKRFCGVTVEGWERNSRWLDWFGVGSGLGRSGSQAHQAAVTAADCAMNSGYVAHGASPSSSPPPPVGAGGGGGVVGVGGGGGRVGDWPLSLQASVPSSPIVPPVKKTTSPSKRPGLAWRLNSNRIPVTVSRPRDAWPATWERRMWLFMYMFSGASRVAMDQQKQQPKNKREEARRNNWQQHRPDNGFCLELPRSVR